MLNSLSINTFRQYDSSLKLWWMFCREHSLDTYEASIPYILSFLTKCYQNGASYGTINTTRSALSLLMGPKIGSDDRLKRFIKGIFRSRPPMPKYDRTWDPGTVLNYLAGCYPNEEVTLEKLTKKLVTILALTTGHRVQTLSMIKISNMKFTDSGVEIYIPDIIKTSRRGSIQPMFHLKTFTQRKEICPVKTIQSYIDQTSSIRNNTDELILTFKKPYRNASTQTISRWIKLMLKEAGIDVTIFTAHSTRHASTSAANRSGVSIDVIRKAAGWSQNSAVFARHYNRPINQDASEFSSVICNTVITS